MLTFQQPEHNSGNWNHVADRNTWCITPIMPIAPIHNNAYSADNANNVDNIENHKP